MILFCITGCETYKQATPPSEMVGTWIGLGRNQLSNAFLDQREIPVFISISDNGSIAGYVGDAGIEKTTLATPVWWFKIFSKSKYKTTFKLQGNIVNRESFRRDGGILVFEGFEDEDLICHFTSTGSQVNSQNMVLSVTNIKLHHPNQ